MNFDIKLDGIIMTLVMNESQYAFDNMYMANMSADEISGFDQIKDSRFGYSYYQFLTKDITALAQLNNKKKRI